MEKVGLILQGGGTRGVYTSGVIDFLLEKNIILPYVIGVSSGACNGAAYVAKQKGYGKTMHIRYINDSRYLGIANLLRTSSYLGMDYIFDELPKKIEKFNFESFIKADSKFYIVTTNCESGQARYFEKTNCKDVFKVIRASCSIPFITPKVYCEGEEFLDGGICDPIPIEKSINDGNIKNIVIMTGPLKYPPKPFFCDKWIYKMFYREKELIKALFRSYSVYCRSIDVLRKLEIENKVFIIKPSKEFKVRMLESNKMKLEELYKLGYRDANQGFEYMMRYLKC